MKAITNKIVDISSFEKFTEFVMGVKVEEKYNFPETFRYKYLKIDFSDGKFSWVMERNFKVCRGVGYVYPSTSPTIVSTFKTEKGAKRNIIKRFERALNKEQIIAGGI